MYMHHMSICVRRWKNSPLNTLFIICFCCKMKYELDISEEFFTPPHCLKPADEIPRNKVRRDDGEILGIFFVASLLLLLFSYFPELSSHSNEVIPSLSSEPFMLCSMRGRKVFPRRTNKSERQTFHVPRGCLDMTLLADVLEP